MKLSQMLKAYFRRQDQREKEEEAQNAQQHLSGLDRQLISRGQSVNKQEKYDTLRSSESKREKADMNMLRGMKPDWQKDSLGVRGNPVEMMRQQAPLEIPRSAVVRRPLDLMDVQQILDVVIPPSENPNSNVPLPPDNVPVTGNDNPPQQSPPTTNTHLTHVDANFYISIGWGYLCSDEVNALSLTGVSEGFDSGAGKFDGQITTVGSLSVTWHQVTGGDFAPLYAQRMRYGYQNNGDGTYHLVSADHF